MECGLEVPACSRDSRVKGLVLRSLSARGVTPHIKGALWRELQGETSPQAHDSLKETAKRHIKATGLEVQLKNAVFQEILKLSLRGVPHPISSQLGAHELREPVEFIRTAQQDWEGKLKKAITTLCSELNCPLTIERPRVDRERLQKKWASLGAITFDQTKFHPIFASRDFVKVVTGLTDENCFPYRPESGIKIQFPLSSRSLLDLRELFSPLHPSCIPDETERSRIAVKVISKGLFSAARQVCKTCCTTEHRRVLWSMALGVDLSLPEHAFRFESLKMSVLCQQLVLDHLLMKDVKEAAANDVEYFVFEDKIHQVLLAFMMDSSVLDVFNYSSATPFSSKEVGGADDVIFPPSGVIPFHGFSMYAAPISYMFERVEHFYALFKAMYLRYFFRLHSLSSHKQGILALCGLFETLLLSRLPELFQHLSHIGVPPLEVIFPWLMYLFSGYLSADQLLVVWDLIIGYDSMEIVPVLAVAILEFRAPNLFQANNRSDVEAILSDVHILNVMPLLQVTLFT